MFWAEYNPKWLDCCETHQSIKIDLSVGSMLKCIICKILEVVPNQRHGTKGMSLCRVGQI